MASKERWRKGVRAGHFGGVGGGGDSNNDVVGSRGQQRVFGPISLGKASDGSRQPTAAGAAAPACGELLRRRRFESGCRGCSGPRVRKRAAPPGVRSAPSVEAGHLLRSFQNHGDVGGFKRVQLQGSLLQSSAGRSLRRYGCRNRS